MNATFKKLTSVIKIQTSETVTLMVLRPARSFQ